MYGMEWMSCGARTSDLKETCNSCSQFADLGVIVCSLDLAVRGVQVKTRSTHHLRLNDLRFLISTVPQSVLRDLNTDHHTMSLPPLGIWPGICSIVLVTLLAVGSHAGDSIESTPDVFDLDSKNWNATFGADPDRPCMVEFYASW